MTVSIGRSVTEQMITARSGLSVYSFISTARDDGEGCPAELAGIERNVHFAH
ncbi:MAG TPA: hypothetical protein VHZ25_07540 [Acidobacteriaceae bacterium]|jgi:hypothetical protein|nr:hypothetical protein [Acidobacteriaceae bacterium]